MNLKNYTLLVSLAAVIGLLLSVVPMAGAALDFRSPESVSPLPELASIEAFISSRGAPVVRVEYTRNLADWQILYEQAKAQHLGGIRHRAARDLVAHGLLFALCTVLLIIHLRWFRRLNS